MLKDGTRISERRDDVRPFDRAGVRERYLAVAEKAFGNEAAGILAGIDALAAEGTVKAVSQKLALA